MVHRDACRQIQKSDFRRIFQVGRKARIFVEGEKWRFFPLLGDDYDSNGGSDGEAMGKEEETKEEEEEEEVSEKELGSESGKFGVSSAGGIGSL